MSAKVAYLDTSAFVKLIVAEPESEQLRERLQDFPYRASATLLRTETIRALRYSRNDHLIGKARRLFATINLIRLDESLLDYAGRIDPTELRSLDAIHLSAALTISIDLGAFFTYDKRLEQAALFQGLNVEIPS